MKCFVFLKEKFQKINWKENKGIALIAVIGICIIAIGALMGYLMVRGLEGHPSTIANLIFSAMISIFHAISGAFLNASATLFFTVIYGGTTEQGYAAPVNIEELKNLQEFKGMWMAIRDLANMFIAIGFVICGIGTALRIQDYEAKKLLVPLVGVAILVNFTYYLWFEIFEISNDIMGAFLEKSPYTANPLIQAINFWTIEGSKTTPEMIIRGATAVFFNSFWAFTYFAYGILYLVRWAMVPVLIIFSPLALVLMIFKFSSQVWERWLSQFLGWCLFGILGAIAIYVSNVLMQGIMGGGIGKVFTNISNDTGFPQIQYFLPLGALLAGLFLSGAGSLIGANTIIAGAKAMVGTIIGAGMAIPLTVAKIGGAISKIEVKGTQQQTTGTTEEETESPRPTPPRGARPTISQVAEIAIKTIEAVASEATGNFTKEVVAAAKDIVTERALGFPSERAGGG